MSNTTTSILVETEQKPSLALSEAPEKKLNIQDDAEEDIDIIGNLWTIPTFGDKYDERQWAKEHMAGAFRIFAKLGYTDGAGGHISLRDPVRPDCFWISKRLPPKMDVLELQS